MFRGPVKLCVRGAQTVVLTLILTSPGLCQQQKLPDAPTPQNNAPVPSVDVPPPASPDQQNSPPSTDNPAQPANTRPPEQQNPQAPPPGSQEIKTVPPGSGAKGSKEGEN